MASWLMGEIAANVHVFWNWETLERQKFLKFT